jgi:hypothetical protein
VTGARAWVGRWGVGLVDPEGASQEERRFGTGPSFVRMTEGRVEESRRRGGGEGDGGAEGEGERRAGGRRGRSEGGCRRAGDRSASMGRGRWGVGLVDPEGASQEERRFGTGPSFVRMTEGRAMARGGRRRRR